MRDGRATECFPNELCGFLPDRVHVLENEVENKKGGKLSEKTN